MILSPTSTNASNAKDAHGSAIVETRAQIVAPISYGFRAKALELLVALSGTLTSANYQQMAGLLWNEYLDSTDLQVFASVRNPVYVRYKVMAGTTF